MRAGGVRRALAVCAALGAMYGYGSQSSPAQQAARAVGADAVERFTPGTGSGYGLEYFPGNVLGLPDTAARADVPSVDARRILALGLGGEIVLRFDRAPIVDSDGPDFVVFENAFRFTIGGRERVYAEPAEVAVSTDGVVFVAFPFDSSTLSGCAGVTPTTGSDPAVGGGGDAFDLAALGLDSVRYVRLRDVTAIVTGTRSHPFWDPTLNGFDLDAVVAIERSGNAAVDVPARAVAATLGPNPAAGRSVLALDLPRASDVRVRLCDMAGRELVRPAEGRREAGPQRIALDVSGLRAGMYVVAVELDGALVQTLRLAVVR